MIHCSNQLIVLNNYSNITSNSKNRIEFVRDEISKIKVDVNDGDRYNCWRDYCGFDKVSARDLSCDKRPGSLGFWLGGIRVRALCLRLVHRGLELYFIASAWLVW